MHRLPHEAQPDAAAWPARGRLPLERPAPGEPITGFRGELLFDEARRAPFGDASGILRALPDAVAVPADAEDAAALVRWAAARRVALVPRGAGTGMPGGNVGAGVSVDLVTRFRSVGAIDPARRTARVEPGVTLAALNAATAPHGLAFPVDPSSGERATFGGMIANNSGGSHTVRHGSTRRWVDALDVVLADGTRVSTRRGERDPHPRLREILERVGEAIDPAREMIEARWPRVRK
ncbi:MAG TPA: FAD-binding oxidoreductase, partial [Longimicrobium sp.]|nr:FAD-binding oxidoreductase [Longimicrobium sp.]